MRRWRNGGDISPAASLKTESPQQEEM